MSPFFQCSVGVHIFTREQHVHLEIFFWVAILFSIIIVKSWILTHVYQTVSVRAHVWVRWFLCNWVWKDLWKCACGCMHKTLFWWGRVSHVHTSILQGFFTKIWCAGVCLAHYHVWCGCGCGRKSMHTNSLIFYNMEINKIFITILSCPERTKQMEEILNFQKPSEGLELVILLHTQY